MRDGITLTRSGLPTVVLVHDHFAHAARMQAKALGMPDLKIYVYPQHGPEEPDENEIAKGLKAADDLPGMLL